VPGAAVLTPHSEFPTWRPFPIILRSWESFIRPSPKNKGCRRLPADIATFHVAALDCPEELALIQKGLRSLDGVGPLHADYIKRRLRVEFDDQRVAVEHIATRLKEIGFPGELPQEAELPTVSPKQAQRRLGLTTIIGGGLLLVAGIIHLVALNATDVPSIWLSRLAAGLSIVSTIISGTPVARAGLRAIRLRALDMNALMTIAAVGALAIGDYFEAATAMFLFGVSLWLESFSLGRARRAVESLLQLTPAVAHRLEPSGVVDVSSRELRPDDVMLVKPGERVPVDGVIERGASAVNQAPITGESLPVDKTVGDQVFAGTLNGEGSLEVRATCDAQNSTLSHIARLVEQAQTQRSATERFVDLFARRYTPAVIGLAILIAAVPPLLAHFGVSWAATVSAGEWFHRGLVLLVIACPCALVISTPVTVVCGLHRAARQGMLVKGGEHLENAGLIDCIAFDKTGTLTTGAAQVTRIEPDAGATADDVLRIAAALESQSEHPLALAVVTAARDRGLTWPEPTDFTALRGFGVRGNLQGETWFAGNSRLFREEQLPGAAQSSASESLTQILVGTRNRFLGVIYLADACRPDAAAAIAELRQLGIQQIAMLTGDRQEVADRVARELDIREVFADLLPQDKVARVTQLVETYPHMAMVGDGVNDAPALAAARLGIVLGSQSSDTALETADVVVMSAQVRRVADLVRLGRRTRRLLSQNIVLALSLKAAVLLLAAAGVATLWMAVAADVGASLIVIFNGMRLLRDRP
jgi:Cd2+/Zn2+-exporting ATPase